MRLPYKSKSNKLKAVVGVSNFILEKYLSYGYFENVPIRKVIYNTKKPNSFTDNFIVGKSKDSKYINFGFIGTLAPNKGIEVLLKSYHKIRKPNYRLFVAGTGKSDYEKDLKLKYKDDSIFFMGRVEPEDFFKNVDVTIVPSIWYENLPGVVYESFTFGVPVIGSNIGGIPEMVIEKVNGKLFDPYKDGELERELLKFETELLNWKKKAEIIRQSAQKFLDYDVWIKQWNELIVQIRTDL